MAVDQKARAEHRELLSGNLSAAKAAALCRVEVVAAYPITPQSPVIEALSDYVAKGELNAKYIPVESEHSALSVLVAASCTGVRTFTATARLGLLLMNEVVHWAGRGRLPIVMAVVASSLGPPIDIGMEQDDVLLQRDTGWIQFYCQNSQEILDTIVQSFRVAEMLSVPIMVCYDGFITSHTYEPVLVPSIEQVDAFLPQRTTRYRLDVNNPMQFFATPGAVDGASYLSRQRRRTQDNLEAAKEVIKQVDQDFHKKFGRSWGILETYKTEDADVILVALTSVAGSAHVVVDAMRAEGKRVGLLRLRLFRPFPKQEIVSILQRASKIAVIDRDISHGRSGILALEIRAAMYDAEKRPPVFGFITGLSGLSVTPDMIHQAFAQTMAQSHPEDEIIWLGIPPWTDD